MKRRQVEELLAQSDVLCVQETRGVATDAAYVPQSHAYYANMLPGLGDFSSGAGGVLFVVRRTLAQSLQSVTHNVLVAGRASALHLVLRSGEGVVIVGVHMDPAMSNLAKRMFLATIRAHVDGYLSSAIVLIGDWNFIGAEDVRIQDAREAGGGGDIVAQSFDAQFTDFAELHQPLHTFGRRRWGHADPLAVGPLLQQRPGDAGARPVLDSRDGGLAPPGRPT